MKIGISHNPYKQLLSGGEPVTVKGFSSVFKMNAYIDEAETMLVRVPSGLGYVNTEPKAISAKPTFLGTEFVGKWRDMLKLLDENFDSFKRGKSFVVCKIQPKAATPG